MNRIGLVSAFLLILPWIGSGQAGPVVFPTRSLRGPASGFNQFAAADSGIFDVKAFGARGDGQSDDTAAIQAAIQAAEPSDGMVYFPCTGTEDKGYVLTKVITVSRKVSLQGCAQGFTDWYATPAYASPLTQKRMAYSGGTVIHLPRCGAFFFTGQSWGSSVRHLSFVCPYNGHKGAVGNVIEINSQGTPLGNTFGGMQPYWISDDVFDDPYNGIVIDNGNGIYIEDDIITHPYGDGVLFRGGETFFVTNLTVTNRVPSRGRITGNCMEIQGGASWTVSQVQCYGGRYGLLVDPGSYGASQFFARTFIADSTNSDAIHFSPSKGNVNVFEFVDSWATSNNGINGGGYGINLQNPNLYDFDWLGGFIRNSAKQGVEIAAGNYIKFEGAQFSYNGYYTYPSPGINVEPGVSNFMIQNCIFGNLEGSSPSPHQNPGIDIRPGNSNNFVITGNMRVEGTPTLLENGATGTHTVIANNL